VLVIKHIELLSFSYALSGICNAAFIRGRISNSTVLYGGIANAVERAAERAFYKNSKFLINNAG